MPRAAAGQFSSYGHYVRRRPVERLGFAATQRVSSRRMGELIAPVAGTVVSVTTVGRRVAAGAVVVVIESMKMEYEVVAESGGEVTRVAAAGETVAEGQAVATIAP